MKELSPATQTVLDAFRSSHTGPGCLAAALRAAVMQSLPRVNNGIDRAPFGLIMDIAAELDAQQSDPLMTDHQIIQAAIEAGLCFPDCWALTSPSDPTEDASHEWGSYEQRKMQTLRRFAELLLANF